MSNLPLKKIDTDIKSLDKSHPVDVFVGSRLRIRRTMLGLSQGVLAKKLNITFQQIQKYEKGQNRVGSSRLYEFSKALGVSVDYFFKGFEEEAKSGFAETAAILAEDDNDYIVDKETLKLLKMFNKVVSSKVREKFISIIKVMIELENSEQKKK